WHCSRDEANSRWFVDLLPSMIGPPTFFENIIVNSIDRPEGLPGHLGGGHTHSKGLFHADDQLQSVDRVQAEAVRSKKREVVPDLIGRGLEQQTLDQHFLDARAQVSVGHS